MTGRFRPSSVGVGLGAAALAALVCATLLAQTPARTPTPSRRLSGGFGRPRTTPLPTPAPAASGGGQAFSDVVHAAHETRDGPAPEKGGVTINNHSLVKNSDKGRVTTSRSIPTPARPASATVAAVAPPTAVPVPGASGDATPTGGTEAEWTAAAAKARKTVTDDKARVAELEAATKKLENDFYAWDDGQYRDRVIKPAWDRARGELDAARQELAAAEKDLEELPERARKAGALPGWIRE
ncbi:MAG TPA: hypothetical protein VN032_08715 [Thermoanaerobaculia bacterium]|jgi:hypothetical protein|nr:hypothetical protein [Thermoanaerobaculia bacterium]